MRTQVLETVEARREGQDALVEGAGGAAPLGGPSRLGPGAVAYACGACERVLWTRAHPDGRGTGATSAASATQRVLIECPGCQALNVLPPAGGGRP